MKLYEIENYYGGGTISLMADSPRIEAETGRKALAIYLKQKGISVKVKCSASNNVHFKVTPIVVENGRVYIDRRHGQRALWYEAIPE